MSFGRGNASITATSQEILPKCNRARGVILQHVSGSPVFFSWGAAAVADEGFWISADVPALVIDAVQGNEATKFPLNAVCDTALTATITYHAL